MTEDKAVVRWFSFENGKPIYSGLMSYHEAVSACHQLKDKPRKGVSAPSVVKRGSDEWRDLGLDLHSFSQSRTRSE